MSLSEEFIKKNGLTPEQVTNIDGFYSAEVIPELKKGWDGKANTDAEGILTGASNYAAKKFGVTVEREQGEKFADYLNRISDLSMKSRLDVFSEKESELNNKIKNFKGNDELKSQLDEIKTKNDNLLKKIVKLEPLEGLDEKYIKAKEELKEAKDSISFKDVIPNFPDTVNTYESDAKWLEFQENTKDKYYIERINNTPYAIDKENPHKKVKLSKLVDADSAIQELLKGRQQSGNHAFGVDSKKVEGIPFDIPVGLTSENQSKLVGDYLERKLGSKLHSHYTSQFRELLEKVKSVN